MIELHLKYSIFAFRNTWIWVGIWITLIDYLKVKVSTAFMEKHKGWPEGPWHLKLFWRARQPKYGTKVQSLKRKAKCGPKNVSQNGQIHYAKIPKQHIICETRLFVLDPCEVFCWMTLGSFVWLVWETTDTTQHGQKGNWRNLLYCQARDVMYIDLISDNNQNEIQ